MAPRRDGAGVRPTDHRRDGRQKTGWTKPQRDPSMGIRSSEACREQVVWHGDGPWVRGRSRRWGVGRTARAGVVDETRTRLLTRVLAAVKPARAAVEKCAVMTNPESRGDERWRLGRRRAASARRDTGDRGATTVRSGHDSDPDSRWTPGWRPAGSLTEFLRAASPTTGRRLLLVVLCWPVALAYVTSLIGPCAITSIEFPNKFDPFRLAETALTAIRDRVSGFGKGEGPHLDQRA